MLQTGFIVPATVITIVNYDRNTIIVQTTGLTYKMINLPVTNSPAYLTPVSATKRKVFLTLKQGANAIKHFLSVIY
jgi:hypothetical protein